MVYQVSFLCFKFVAEFWVSPSPYSVMNEMWAHFAFLPDQDVLAVRQQNDN